MLDIHFNDKKEIYFLSSIHKANVIDTRKRHRQGNVVRKLKLIDDYDRYMGGVDKNDEMIGTYSCVTKSIKWTQKVAFHFIEEGVLNAHILFKKERGTKPLTASNLIVSPTFLQHLPLSLLHLKPLIAFQVSTSQNSSL